MLDIVAPLLVIFGLTTEDLFSDISFIIGISSLVLATIAISLPILPTHTLEDVKKEIDTWICVTSMASLILLFMGVYLLPMDLGLPLGTPGTA